jgi:hypothetical protein
VNSSLLLCGLALAQPAAEPPVAGRPLDWSGTIGGPYVVTIKAEPTDLPAEDQLTLTLVIAATDPGTTGNLRNLKRIALTKLDVFKAFAVEDLDGGYNEYLSRQWFRYLLRPRSTEVKEIPRLKIVYFNPRTGRYQTTYSDPVPLTVRARKAPVPVAEVPPWIMQEWKDEENELVALIPRMFEPPPRSIDYWWRKIADAVGLSSTPYHDRLYARAGDSYITAFALVIPPLMGVAWYAIWRFRNPDAARRANICRSRAAADALRTLAQTVDDPPRRVRRALEDYLQARVGLSPSARTPPEVVAYLRGSSLSPLDVDEIERLLRRCDDARFAPSPAEPSVLIAEAESLILKWEERS